MQYHTQMYSTDEKIRIRPQSGSNYPLKVNDVDWFNLGLMKYLEGLMNYVFLSGGNVLDTIIHECNYVLHPSSV